MVQSRTLATLLLFSIALLAGSQNFPMDPALRWVRSPTEKAVQYDYILTARLRLLLFWVGWDDVGGGYIRRSSSMTDPSVHMTQVLFGSDPDKAPRHINYWGAATEAANDRASAFFGLMKSTRAASASEAKAENEKQREQGAFAFRGILSFVDEKSALSRVVPLLSDMDFNWKQLDLAQEAVFKRLNDRPIRQLAVAERKCQSTRGFLQAVNDLIGKALSSEAVPSSVCYLYNARNYSLTLQERLKVPSETIRINLKNGKKTAATYSNLVRARFVVLNDQTRERTTFELLLPTSGALHGVPVKIIHQPNWWFQIEMNLATAP